MIDRSAMCSQCIYEHTSKHSEWQCHICHAWFYTEKTPEGDIHTYRLYDRDTLPRDPGALVHERTR